MTYSLAFIICYVNISISSNHRTRFLHCCVNIFIITVISLFVCINLPRRFKVYFVIFEQVVTNHKIQKLTPCTERSVILNIVITIYHNSFPFSIHWKFLFKHLTFLSKFIKYWWSWSICTIFLQYIYIYIQNEYIYTIYLGNISL